MKTERLIAIANLSGKVRIYGQTVKIKLKKGEAASIVAFLIDEVPGIVESLEEDYLIYVRS